MASASLQQIFDSFNQLPVLVIGDVMLDAYIWGNVERVSPEAPVPIVNVKQRDYRLGGAANVALNLKSLGAEPVLCALVGDDEAGAKFFDRLKFRNIAAEGIIVSKHRPTTVKTRVIASHQHVVRVDDESDRPANAEEEAQLLTMIDKLLPRCKAVIFEDYDKGVINERIIAHVVAQADQLGIPSIVDPKKRNFLAYKEVSLFKPNLKELREGLKLEIQSGNMEQVKSAVSQLKQLLNAKALMVTLSEHGIYLDGEKAKIHQKAHAREIADVSGAGDTVVSIAALCVAAGLSEEQTAALANLGGGLVCQHVGVVPIDKHALLKEAEKIWQ